MAVFRQPSLLLAGVAGATFAKRGEGSRKSDLFRPKWEQGKLLRKMIKNENSLSGVRELANALLYLVQVV
jgi:hypothetical protein